MEKRILREAGKTERRFMRRLGGGGVGDSERVQGKGGEGAERCRRGRQRDG